MKFLVRTIRTVGCTLFFAFNILTIQAQETKSQKFVVHEDVVIPSKVAAYEAATKKFAATMSEHNATDAAFLTVSLDDMRYLYVSAIDNLAALDNNPFEKVVEAMGEEGFADMMSGYHDTFETHKNYVINLSHELSYNSGEILMEGVNYRNFTYYFVDPDKWQEAKAIAKEWTERHAAANAPHGYRIYTGGIGTEPMIMVVQWAKNAQEYHANQAANQSALGDVEDLQNRTMAITRKMESYDGMIRPDLSYQPKSAMAEN
jgi:hypothetical protein